MPFDFLKRMLGQRPAPHESRYRAACTAWSDSDGGNAVFGQVLWFERQPTGYQLAELRVPTGLPIMAITGHKTRAVFDRYNITAEADLKSAADLVGRFQSGANQGQVAPVVQASRVAKSRK